MTEHRTIEESIADDLARLTPAAFRAIAGRVARGAYPYHRETLPLIRAEAKRRADVSHA